ncbi:hypothetical protein [Clostridium brassicae]|uniref:DUF2508 family protein n=1 Tax=Clostridium brassicae TaxID=2999072 RepID=A0ABT4D6G2_9CLOT|nr:hypothetical protein [Clostridium brassicae]MCY6957867.1 hypothetical protein [Clostridium brassicae]
MDMFTKYYHQRLNDLDTELKNYESMFEVAEENSELWEVATFKIWEIKCKIERFKKMWSADKLN